jgi:hypothetical protein
MALRRFHSRTFEALKVTAEALGSVSYPTLLGSTPKIIYGDPFGVQDGTREVIGVALTIDDGSLTWERMLAGRDETFTIQIVVRSEIPGRTGAQVVERLSDLTEVVEGVFFDLDTARPALLAVSGFTNLSMISRVAPDVRATEQGYVGAVDVSFAVRCRI